MHPPHTHAATPFAPTAAQHAREARRHWQRGQVHARAGRWNDAREAHGRAAELVPGDALYALNHARALLSSGRAGPAAAEALRAAGLEPREAVIAEFAAECLMSEGRHLQAAAAVRALPADVPRTHITHAVLGLALTRAGAWREAIEALCAALAQKPDWAEMHHNLGLCFGNLDMPHEAVQCFETALELGLGALELGARGLACFHARGSCRWDAHDVQLAALSAAVRALPDDARVAATPFAHIGLGADRHEQLRVARSCIRHFSARTRPLAPCASDWRPGARRLRIGYVSADFHQHATAILMVEMLERRDRERFEVHLYSHGPADGSAMRARVEAACESFVDIRTLSDAEAAARIRADGIDLLVDLKGHTRDARLDIFAHRPAPIQAAFLGFPGTTGSEVIDYLIGDAIVTPFAHADAYSEKLAHLPVCYQPNDRHRPRPEAPTRASQRLPEDALVLCGFNQPFKISPEVFDSWCRLLHARPEAVLWLLEWNPQALPNLRREAAARGIDPARIVGAPRVDPAAHVARVRLADVFLDTWPCNAHTTASDALWAGVPVVTMLGETFASRVAGSLLHAVGLPELVCRDTAHYERTVRDLAADPARRAALRERLDDARSSAPLFDTERFARDIESLYLRMAGRHAAGLLPDHLPAATAPRTAPAPADTDRSPTIP